TFSFTVIDDDNSPPTVQILNDWVIYDGEEYLEIVLKANDPSGIYRVYASFEGEEYDFHHSENDYYHIRVPNPLELGDFEVEIWVWDNDNDHVGDRKAFLETLLFSVVDDDEMAPDITITYNGLNTDENPGFWHVVVTDPSDISEIIIKIGETVVDGSTGCTNPYVVDISVPNTLGEHTIHVYAKDADLDRGEEDQEFSTQFDNVAIVDDDTSGPDITITYNGLNTDENPGFWHVVVTDPSDISEIIIKIGETVVDGSTGCTSPYVVDIPVPNTLGEHTIHVYAKMQI
ncbi:unnamed protein product, partial [marine sediment metagenome]